MHQVVFESAPDAIFVVDEAGIIVRVNPEVERMLGYAPQDIVGRRVEVLGRGGHAAHRMAFAASPHVRPMGRLTSALRKTNRGDAVTSSVTRWRNVSSASLTPRKLGL